MSVSLLISQLVLLLLLLFVCRICCVWLLMAHRLHVSQLFITCSITGLSSILHFVTSVAYITNLQVGLTFVCSGSVVICYLKVSVSVSRRSRDVPASSWSWDIPASRLSLVSAKTVNVCRISVSAIYFSCQRPFFWRNCAGAFSLQILFNDSLFVFWIIWDLTMIDHLGFAHHWKSCTAVYLHMYWHHFNSTKTTDPQLTCAEKSEVSTLLTTKRLHWMIPHDRHTNGQTPGSSVTTVFISCIRCSLETVGEVKFR